MRTNRCMRAKLRAVSVTPYHPPHKEGGPLEPQTSESLVFMAVGPAGSYPADGTDENNSYALWTPAADLNMTVNNPALFGKITAGEEFYVDFTRASDPPQTTGLSFGDAIEAAKAGKRISREGWNGKGMFVFMQVPSEIPADIIPRMQSLPDTVKAEFERRGEPIRYSNQFALVKPDNSINGWTPSPADTLAEDWTILD